MGKVRRELIIKAIIIVMLCLDKRYKKDEIEKKEFICDWHVTSLRLFWIGVPVSSTTKSLSN